METTNIQHSRFSGTPWFSTEERMVLVGGAGGIGSWLALLLSRANITPMIVDFDILEAHNLAGQIFPKSLIGTKKVTAVEKVIKDFSGVSIFPVDAKVDEKFATAQWTFSAFDNMKARHDMFRNWKETFGNDPDAIFIDGRLEVESMWIYCVTGASDRIAKYEALLQEETDESIQEAECTMKQTSHSAAMIAANMVGFFTNHITNVMEGEQMRVVPYKWQYFIPLVMIEDETS